MVVFVVLNLRSGRHPTS